MSLVITLDLPVHDGRIQPHIVSVKSLEELVSEIKLCLTIDYNYCMDELMEHSRTYAALISIHRAFAEKGVYGEFPDDEELVRVAKDAIRKYGSQLANEEEINEAIDNFDDIKF